MLNVYLFVTDSAIPSSRIIMVDTKGKAVGNGMGMETKSNVTWMWMCNMECLNQVSSSVLWKQSAIKVKPEEEEKEGGRGEQGGVSPRAPQHISCGGKTGTPCSCSSNPTPFPHSQCSGKWCHLDCRHLRLIAMDVHGSCGEVAPYSFLYAFLP
ncbi:hypothetical protein F3Y22_tig00111298pilonHSYRG00056 [Hibiscus syriacus]|uniref:Uncharacterized protein n=1 Tax=Hibiscus syriacus TaxID=106335 RepID=A0A6A2YR70_HIBSY|nr:hypothetical protein F3Y22_tig00111298pilonHSYRG00056 [Hibiscus syriacus]